MATAITQWKCDVCGAVYLTEAEANTCGSKHPGTISAARNVQTYRPGDIMPCSFKVTHNSKTYTYNLLQ